MMKKVIKFSTFLCLKNSGRLDSDFDGLEDWEELELGTDPFRVDTDGDGVKDGDQYKTQKSALELMFMKDLFVPHEGNGFKPHALHPSRILFHASAAILIKVLVVGFIVALPIEAWLAPDILTSQGQRIVSLTNQVRTAQNLPVLAESKVLNRAASAKVTDMLAANYFAHVSPAGKGVADWLKMAGYGYSVAGENLAMGYAKAEEIVEAWRQSPSHYNNMVDPDFEQIGVAVASGQFEGEETTMAAQFFGEPQVVATAPAQVLAASSQAVKPSPAKAEIKLKVLERPVPDKKLVRAEAVLEAGTAKAEIKVGQNTIPLQPTVNGDKWTGSSLVSDSAATNKAVVPASLVVTDQAGNQSVADLNANVQSVKPNFFAEYNYLKTSPLAGMLWSFTSGYYLAMLLVAVVALTLNVFIQIRKQHPHLIVSTMSLICLLAILAVV